MCVCVCVCVHKDLYPRYTSHEHTVSWSALNKNSLDMSIGKKNKRLEVTGVCIAGLLKEFRELGYRLDEQAVLTNCRHVR